jgi:hypothetical protein
MSQTTILRFVSCLATLVTRAGSRQSHTEPDQNHFKTLQTVPRGLNSSEGKQYKRKFPPSEEGCIDQSTPYAPTPRSHSSTSSNIRRVQSPRQFVQRSHSKVVVSPSGYEMVPVSTVATTASVSSHTDQAGHSAYMKGKRMRDEQGGRSMCNPVSSHHYRSAAPRPLETNTGNVQSDNHRVPTAMFRPRPASGRVFAGARPSTGGETFESFL